jgi:hypothetical protein
MTELFTLSDPIWIGDLGTETKTFRLIFAIFFCDERVIGKNCFVKTQQSTKIV